jgi:hypothetical protein
LLKGQADLLSMTSKIKFRLPFDVAYYRKMANFKFMLI